MKTVVVLGCHRSATSLVAAGLAAAGVHMGDHLLGPNPTNPHGHFEDEDFVAHNDRLIQSAGGAWYVPPPVGALREAFDVYADETEQLVARKARRAEAQGVEAWGWKDPRTVLTWEAYRDLLDDPIVVTVRRSVEESARSLHRRDGLSLDQCRSLVAEYMRRLDAVTHNGE